MGPRVSVCRKGENIFLTVEGEINFESSRELLAMVRQMMNTLMKCAAQKTRVTYCLKTRATVDLERMAHIQEAVTEPPGNQEGGGQAQPEPGLAVCQEESARPHPHNGLTLVKGGAV